MTARPTAVIVSAPAMGAPGRVSAVRGPGRPSESQETTSTAVAFGEVRDGTAEKRPHPSSGASSDTTPTTPTSPAADTARVRRNQAAGPQRTRLAKER